MSDNIISEGNSLKCRRGSRGVKKNSEPNVHDITQIFSSLFTLSGQLESRPPRKPKVPVNHASFVEKNSEIHQMVVESNEWQGVSNNVKRQKKKKNKNFQQSQDNLVKSEETNQMVAESSDSKRSPKDVKRQRKKNVTNVTPNQQVLPNHISVENLETISIRTNEFSVQTKVFSLQSNENNFSQTPEFVTADFNASTNSSQGVS